MVILVGNGHDELNSIHGLGCVYISHSANNFLKSNNLRKGLNQTILPPADWLFKLLLTSGLGKGKLNLNLLNFALKNDLVSHSSCAEGLVNTYID